METLVPLEFFPTLTPGYTYDSNEIHERDFDLRK